MLLYTAGKDIEAVVNPLVFLLCAMTVVLWATAAHGQGRKLSDSELDKVTAGSASTPSSTVPPVPESMPVEFKFSAPAGSRHTVEGSGTTQVLAPEALPDRDVLVIRDQAQQNLQSFINVTAVNSRIQVLVNLNITINSTVGAVQQLNVSAAGAP